MTENLVEVHHLKKYFHQGRPDEVHAIDDVSFNIQRGEVFGLVGESGSGKTTTGRCILNLYQPTSGDIIYDGEDVTKLKGHQKLKEFHQKTSMIFQDPYSSLNPRKQIHYCLEQPLINFGLVPREQINKRIDELLRSVGLTPPEDFWGRYPHELSGGQRQRLAIARAFIKNAPIVILDEATSALDNKSEAVVQKAIDNLMQDRTVFVIAHRLSTVQNADKIVVINDGEIIEQGKHEDLLNIENGAYLMLYNAQFKKK